MNPSSLRISWWFLHLFKAGKGRASQEAKEAWASELERCTPIDDSSVLDVPCKPTREKVWFEYGETMGREGGRGTRDE